MKCSHVHLPGGVVAIVCSSAGPRPRPRRCEDCSALTATLQCDWKLSPPDPVTDVKTCDRWICAGCAKEVGLDKHLCKAHQEAYKAWQQKK